MGSRISSFFERGGGLRVLLCIACLVLVHAPHTYAQTLVLKIRAINPPSATNAQSVEIHAELPGGVTAEDVLDAAGLDVRFDVADNLYHMYGDVVLEPREVKVFEVQIRDVWQVSEEKVERMRELAKARHAQLVDTDSIKTADRVRDSILQNTERILSSQQASEIGKVRPIEHIRAFELNTKLLRRTSEELGHLENLVIAAGMDPETMEGVVDRSPIPPRFSMPDAERTVTISFTVTNPSSTNRLLEVRRMLPAEVLADDLVDTGTLSVGYDEKLEAVFVYAEDVSFAAEETKRFDIAILDRWVLANQRVESLERRTTNLVAVIQRGGEQPAIQDRLQKALAELDALRKKAAPIEMSPEYVAFYRGKAAALDGVERELMSVEDMLHRKKQKVPPIIQEADPWIEVDAPDKRTTWIIIYTLLGLAILVTVTFFLRWQLARRGSD